MEQKLTDAFDAVHMEEKCMKKVEAAMNSKSESRSTTRPVWRSIAAAAACMLLLLPVTAFGNGLFTNPVSLGEQQINEEQAYYKVIADVVTLRKDQFSATLQQNLETGTIQQVFQDKESLETYLGISLASSSTLEDAIVVENLAESFEYGFYLRPQLELDPSARYVLTSIDWSGNSDTLNPNILKVSAHRVFQNTEVYLDAWIVLDSVTTEQLEEGILGESFPPVTGYNMEIQRDENGNFLLNTKGESMVELKQFTSTDYDFISTTYNMPNGCAATIITAKLIEPNGTSRHREYMGYFVQNGILYTIRPYAIYDPDLDYPSQDLDCRNVLLAALDTFE